ncbi:MAG: trypsin-like serine protease [Saprospiraceae bacterium]|nr:trypsin-like serine protease [Saprospiraceae bacterium]
MKCITIIGTLLALVFFCSSTLYSPPIVIRHDKPDAEYIKLAEQFKPYMCHLNLPDCEGTIISDQWAITAAHCAIEIKKKLEKGKEHCVIMNDQKVVVQKVIIHPKWETDESYDLALLQFKKRPKSTKIAKLYTATDELGQVTYFVGKGYTGDGLTGIKKDYGQLRAATNRVKSVSERWLAWEFDDPRKPSDQLTAYEGISGPGDSGGPAFILRDDGLYIAGISSFQDHDGVEGIYGVTEYYTRISNYIDWIQEQLDL